MTKLIVLALAFTALVAFASAHKTIVTTTTIEDENRSSRQQQQCRHIEDQSFNRCDMYFQSQGSPFENRGQRGQGQQGQGMRQMCCQELENVDQQCQCEAVKKVFRDAMMTQQQQQQQQRQRGGQMVEQLMQKAERIISQCNLQITPQQCQVGTIRTTTVITEDENPSFRTQHGGGSSQQQCRQMIPQRFNQCERFIEQALQSGFPRIEMSINKHHGGQQQQFQQQCCNELENVPQQCQCQALEKVYEQAMEQQQGQGRQQQGSHQGEQQMQQVQQVVQSLKNQCNLQAHQCRIPSEMF